MFAFTPTMLVLCQMASAQPMATATLAPDGAFALTLRPTEEWSSAEVTISGAGSHDLGQSTADVPLTIAGDTSWIGTFTINVRAVATDGRGINWMFEVEPTLVPISPPDLSGDPIEKKKKRWWPF